MSDFQKKWVASDAWRGHYDAVPKKGTGWKKVQHNGEGWVTGEWDDAPKEAKGSYVKKKLAHMKENFRKEGKDFKAVFNRTSNAFSTGYDTFTRKRKMASKMKK